MDFDWHANGGTDNSATISPGGTVTISYPSGSSMHNADFGSGSQPTSCTQTAGASTGSVPPLPHSPTPPGWSGTCQFDTAGTYTFHCDLHPFMTATITVQAGGPTTTTTTPTGTTTGATTTDSTTSSTTTTAGSSTTSTAPPPPTEPTVPIIPPSAGRAASAIAVPVVQHGATVRGSARISRSGAGGRLEVDLLASPRALRAHASRLTRVGRLVRTHLAAGRIHFSVRLNRAARRALHRGHRLALTVKIIVRPTHGATVSVVRRIKVLS